MITNFKYFLNEKLIHPKFNPDYSVDDYAILSFKKYILFIPQNDIWNLNIKKSKLKKLKKLLNIKSTDNLSLDEYIREERPDIIFFDWKTNTNVLNLSLGISFNQDINTSKDFIDTLKFLKNKLNIQYLDVNEVGFQQNGEEIYYENTFNISDLITNFNKDIKVRKLPKYVYHGTTSEYLNKILSVGLRPGKSKTNFDRIYHHDRLFYTSSVIEAAFYATNSVLQQNKGFPIILKISTDNFDTSKIDLDYDFYIDYIKRGHSHYNEIYYNSKSNLINKLKEKPIKSLKKLKDKYIGATYRKFSYLGHIYPKNIISVLYSESYNNEKFEEEIVIKNNKKEIIDFFDWSEEFYSGQNEYYLDYDAYLEYQNEYNENDEIEENNKNMKKLKYFNNFLNEHGVTGIENHNNVSRGNTPVKTTKSTFNTDYSPKAAELEIIFDNIQEIIKEILKTQKNLNQDDANDFTKKILLDSKERQNNIKHLVAQLNMEGKNNNEIANIIVNKYYEKTIINQDFNNIYTNEEIPNKINND